MRKTKTQKGITLIALIITIVVLLILAAVAISSIQNDGILGYATNAAKDYNQAVKNEQEALGKYEEFLNKYNGVEEVGDATVGTIVTKNSTIDGKAYGATNPIIPAGFKAINTDTSSWDAADLAAEVKKGLVISDGTNEFVWIPVANINEMVKIAAIGGTDANGRTNYQGKLYDFTGETTVERTDYGQEMGKGYYREPANMLNYEDDSFLESAEDFTTITWTENLYQESFNKMAESVAKYKGFYVGRYEMGLDANGVAQSSSGATLATGTNVGYWHDFYEKAITYSKSGVISEMIWGCQYDAMLRWMEGNNIDVTSKTGSAVLNNIYGLIGSESKWEWTQETCNCKVSRGGGYSGCEGRYYEANSSGIETCDDNLHAPYCRADYDAWFSDNAYGTRLSLYVEV